MKRLWITLIAGVSVVSAADAIAAGPNPVIPCVPPSVVRLPSFKALPQPIQADLLGRFAPGEPPARRAAMAGELIATPGADWQVTDVISPGRSLPGRRFVLGARSGDRLWVWYESGGIARQTHVAAYQGGDANWRLVRGLAGGTPAELCPRLGRADTTAVDAFW